MDDEEEGLSPNVRLYSLPKREPDSLNMGPIIAICVVAALTFLAANVPCLSLRLSYILYSDSNEMSVLQMSCSKADGECVCRQKSSEIRGGGGACVLKEDLKVRCRTLPADYLGAPPN